MVDLNDFKSDIEKCAEEIRENFTKNAPEDWGRQDFIDEITAMIRRCLSDITDGYREAISEFVADSMQSEYEDQVQYVGEFIEDNFDIAVAAREGKSGAAELLVRNMAAFSDQKLRIKLNDRTAAILAAGRPADEYAYR